MQNEKDPLKEFVQLHRDEMDTHTPPDLNWAFMANDQTNEKPKGKMVRLSSVIKWVAASIAIIVSVNVGYWMFSTKSQVNEVATSELSMDSIELFQVSDEIAEIEFYYSAQIAEALKEIEGLGYENEIQSQIQLLDAEYSSLKKELGANVDNETVIYQMIDNYRLKLELLENAIRSIDSGDQLVNNEAKNEKNENEEYTIYH